VRRVLERGLSPLSHVNAPSLKKGRGRG